MGYQMNAKFLIVGFAALSLSACTSINPFTGEQQLSNTTGGTLLGAGGGAVVGGLIGVATGNDPRVGALLGAGIGGLSGAMIGNYMDQQEAELRQQLQGTGVSVTRVGQQIILNMPSNITFAVDSDRIQPQFNETLISVALVLKKFNKTVVDDLGCDSAGEPGRRSAPFLHYRQGRGRSDRIELDRVGPGAESACRNSTLAHPGLSIDSISSEGRGLWSAPFLQSLLRFHPSRGLLGA